MNEQAYERKVEVLEQRSDNQLLEIALSATEAYSTPESSADEVVDQVKDAVEVWLFGSPDWEGVKATDISDIALDYANRAWSQTRTWKEEA